MRRRSRQSRRRRLRPRGHDLIDARRFAHVDLDEIRRLAEDIGRRVAALLARLTRTAPPSLRPDPRDDLRARRLQEAARRPRGSPSITWPKPKEPMSGYRPRL